MSEILTAIGFVTIVIVAGFLLGFAVTLYNNVSSTYKRVQSMERKIEDLHRIYIRLQKDNAEVLK